MDSSSVGVEVMIGRGSKSFHIDKTYPFRVPENILSLPGIFQRGASAFWIAPAM